MTDGDSQGTMAGLQKVRRKFTFGMDVPIFSISFGNANPQQLENIASQTSGRVFDGSKNLAFGFYFILF